MYVKFFEYGFRDYDSQLGRWHCVDPMAERYHMVSPYAYCLNNPINNIDLLGLTNASAAQALHDLWWSDNGGTWSSGGGTTFFSSSEEAESWGESAGLGQTVEFRWSGGLSVGKNLRALFRGWGNGVSSQFYRVTGYNYVPNIPNDYFTKDGTYIGSYGTGNQVMILQGAVDDYDNSLPLSQNSLRGSVIQIVIAHYNSDVEPNDIFPTKDSPTILATGFTSSHTGNKKTGDSYCKNRPYILVYSYKGFVESLLDDKNNLTSILLHEKHHFDSDIRFENGIYIGKATENTYGGGDLALVRHLFGAYLTQIKDASYANTTSELKRQVNQAIKFYTLSISHLPLRAAVMNYFKTNFNFNFNKSYESY